MGPKIHYNSWLFRLPLLRNYSAIVLGSHIFTKHSSLSPQLLRHEMVHIEQVKRHGKLGFYGRYLFEYLRLLWRFRNHRRAYWENRFEVEARAAEETKLA